MADTQREIKHGRSNGYYPSQHPHMSISDSAMPNNFGGQRQPPVNYGWMVTAILWIIGGIFTAGTLYSVITGMKQEFSEQKVQVQKLSEAVTRMDERQNFTAQVLQEIRNDVKVMRREKR